MFARKLQSLDYDTSFSISDERSVRNLIHWLENMKIRFYPIESRSCLLPESPSWNQSFNKYLDEIGYTGQRQETKFILDWLLNLALRYEMEDLRSQMHLSRLEVNDLKSGGPSSATNLSSIDVNSPEFMTELRNLSKMVNVPFYEQQPLVTLKAIALLLRNLKQSCSKNCNNVQPQPSDAKKKRLSVQANERILNLPFSSKANFDPQLNRAANVLRLLYINDLRELQSQINQLLVELQSVTANPKTDTLIGKVGR